MRAQLNSTGTKDNTKEIRKTGMGNTDGQMDRNTRGSSKMT